MDRDPRPHFGKAKVPLWWWYYSRHGSGKPCDLTPYWDRQPCPWRNQGWLDGYASQRELDVRDCYVAMANEGATGVSDSAEVVRGLTDGKVWILWVPVPHGQCG